MSSVSYWPTGAAAAPRRGRLIAADGVAESQGMMHQKDRMRTHPTDRGTLQRSNSVRKIPIWVWSFGNTSEKRDVQLLRGLQARVRSKVVTPTRPDAFQSAAAWFCLGR